jgi:hypothetical protein
LYNCFPQGGKTKNEDKIMKRSMLALSLLAVLALSACNSNSGAWTPMSGGRTAGTAGVEVHQADTAVSQGLRK